jgi:hypothetical protein
MAWLKRASLVGFDDEKSGETGIFISLYYCGGRRYFSRTKIRHPKEKIPHLGFRNLATTNHA